MTDIVERLRACENDPMWADHAEVPKYYLAQAAERIEELEALLIEARTDIAAAVNHEYPYRDEYPDQMRRFKRDMDLCYRIDAAIREKADD